MLPRVATAATCLLAPIKVFAARPFLNEPDTGFADFNGQQPQPGGLPPLEAMMGLPDFEWAARNYLPTANYSYYRTGAGGEWSYRNNLEVFQRYRLRPRVMRDVTGVGDTLTTEILGHNFSAPFFISPCARADYGHPDAELNLVRAAGAAGILYIASGYSYIDLADITTAQREGQVIFSQQYVKNNDTENQVMFDVVEKAGAKAVVWTVDAPGNPNRQRAARRNPGSKWLNENVDFIRNTWEVYQQYKAMSSVPIILKGIQSAADAVAAVEHGVSAIVLSNHGGRNLDGSPSALEIALEIRREAPQVFDQTTVLADGGVRYGTDALRLLALGVRAVGIGRPAMFANVYGEQGVRRAIEILRRELVSDAANLGLASLKEIDPSYVDWTPNHWYG